jgi:hypothetical protein
MDSIRPEDQLQVAAQVVRDPRDKPVTKEGRQIPLYPQRAVDRQDA